jgi:tight adherence protein C
MTVPGVHFGAAGATLHVGIAALGPLATLVLALALAAALLAGWRLWRLGEREDRAQRLDALRSAVGDRAGAAPNRAPRWYDRLGSIVAASRAVGVAEQQRLLGALAKAGIRRQAGLARLFASKLGSALVLAVLAWVFVEWQSLLVGHTVYRVILLAAALMLGWRLPDFVLSRLAVRRRRRLEEGVPDALDLMVISAEAGLSLDQAVEEVARNLHLSNSPTAEEFAITAAEMRVLSNRAEAFENLVKRTGLTGLRSIAATLSQAIRFGTPLAESLRMIAAEMRTERIARLEERAARLPVLLSIPLMLFILPSLLIVIGTPVGLRIFDTLKHVFHL